MKKSQSKLPINKILKQIFKICNRKYIKSIILMGSASRNELTTQIDNKGYILSDVEICVLYKSFIRAIHKRKKIKLNIEIYKIEILFTHKLFLKSLKAPLIYDLKTTGKVLWGKDIRKSIWINDPKQIPHWEGVRLLYNRLIDFEILIWKYKNNLPIRKNEEYYNVKLLIAIGEYIMIKMGKFQSSYWDKLQFLKENFKNNKNINQIIDAIRYKLNIETEFDNLKLIEFTSILTYNILKKINLNLNLFKIPFSLIVSNIFKRIENRDFLNFFSGFKIIEIYKRAFQLLDYYVNFPQKYLKHGNKIGTLIKTWNTCLQIQSSFI